MNEDQVKHLEIIQSVIARMAANSFLCKGWSLTLVAGLFAIAAKECNASFAILAFFPGFSFWGLDAYYLRQERSFRRLYDAVRCSDYGEWRSRLLFCMDASQYQRDVTSWPWLLFSPTVVALHGVVLSVVTVIIVVISLGC